MKVKPVTFVPWSASVSEFTIRVDPGSPALSPRGKDPFMERFWARLRSDERGQDVAEYATMIAIILLIATAGARLIGINVGSVIDRVIAGMR